MRPYPAHFEADVVLSDGGPVHVRPIRPEDGPRLAAFHDRLSPETIYFRFFTPHPHLSEAEITRFTTVDYDDRMALVATLGDEFVGVARYDRWPGTDEAETAYTVDDKHQGRGIATVLLEHLAAAAREVGIRVFTAEVLPGNRKMLGVFRSVGFEVQTEFDSGVVELRFALAPTAQSEAAVVDRERRSEARSVARILSPSSIAVIGASRSPQGIGHLLVRNLIANGFAGPVYPINPQASHVAGVPAWPSVLAVPAPIDLAIIAVARTELDAVIDSCVAKGVRATVIVTDLPGPAGSEEERALVSLARRNGMRVVGPASLGVINTAPDVSLHATFAGIDVLPGAVGLTSHSGPLGAAILEQCRRVGLGISTFVATGKKADVSGNDLLQYWEQDERTRVVLMYIVSFGNPERFGRISRRVARTKPVVVVAPGVDASRAGLFRGAGLIRVATLDELLDVARLLDQQPLPGGARVGVVVNGDGPLRSVRYALEPSGLQLAWTIELGPLASASHYAEALSNPASKLGGEVPDYDALIAVYAPPISRELDEVASVIEGASRADPARTYVACALGRDDGPLQAGGCVPAYTFPDDAVRALGHVATYALWRKRPAVADFDRAHPPAAFAEVRAIVDHAVDARPDGTLLPIVAGAELLRAVGIDSADARGVTSAEAAVAAAQEIGYPVILKAAALERVRSGEAGGIAFDLRDAQAVRDAYDRMTALHGRGMIEAIVQQMATPGTELRIAIEPDPSFGRIVVAGMGGAFADVIADEAKGLLPLDAGAARALIESARVAPVLASLGATGAVAALLERLSLLASMAPEIDQLSLNPVLASSVGATVTDWKIHVRALPKEPVSGLRRLS